MAAGQHVLGERRADRASIFLDVLNVFLFFLQLLGGNND
jgi:FtsH-binding integral membrane protein